MPTRTLRWLGDAATGAGYRAIDAVGHRVVHGGERFTRSVLIDDFVINEIEETATRRGSAPRYWPRARPAPGGERLSPPPCGRLAQSV